MFNFFQKKNVRQRTAHSSFISHDIHSHILPALDDGAPDLATSLQLVKGMYEMGIRKAVATPHIIGDMYRNTPELIEAAFAKLKIACIEESIDVELSAAAEYMLDDYFMGLLKKKDRLLTIHKNIILTELSYSTPPDNLEEISFELNIGGYKPIMAHPERYFYFHKNYDNFYRLKELGFSLQVNLLSVIGYYGPSFAKVAKFILQKGLADFIGTDMHHIRHLEVLLNKENYRIVKKCLGEKIYNDFSGLN